MERVVALSIEGHAVACPFSALRQMPVVNHRIAAKDIVVFYSGGTRSAFEGALGAESRIVGSTGVYEPLVDGEKHGNHSGLPGPPFIRRLKCVTPVRGHEGGLNVAPFAA